MENHRRGRVLDSMEKTLYLTRTMKVDGKNRVVKFIKGTYDKGIKLAQNVIKQIEKKKLK